VTKEAKIVRSKLLIRVLCFCTSYNQSTHIWFNNKLIWKDGVKIPYIEGNLFCVYASFHFFLVGKVVIDSILEL
jgi:hypothetical protein